MPSTLNQGVRRRALLLGCSLVFQRAACSGSFLPQWSQTLTVSIVSTLLHSHVPFSVLSSALFLSGTHGSAKILPLDHTQKQ